MSLLRRSRRAMNQINVVPYIDVMLVLLVIFMVTTPMFSAGVIDLPTVAASAQAKQEPIQLQIQENGALVLSLAGETTPVVQENLLATLQPMLAKEARPVVIAADKNLAYGQVMDIMALLQKEGVARVGLLVKTDE